MIFNHENLKMATKEMKICFSNTKFFWFVNLLIVDILNLVTLSL